MAPKRQQRRRRGPRAGNSAPLGVYRPPTVDILPWNRAVVVSALVTSSTAGAVVRLTALSVLTAIKSQLGIQSSAKPTSPTFNGIAFKVLSQTIYLAPYLNKCVDLSAAWFSIITTDDGQASSLFPDVLKASECISSGPGPAMVTFHWPRPFRDMIMVESNANLGQCALTDIYSNVGGAPMAAYTTVLWRCQDGEAIPTSLSYEVELTTQHRSRMFLPIVGPKSTFI